MGRKMISKRIKNYHNLAMASSKLSDYERIKIGAVLVKKGDVISIGYNRKKTHPTQKKYNKFRNMNGHQNDFIHAEIDAIIKSKSNLNGAFIYISRQTCNGELGMCRPCPACMEAIRESGISRVYYTSNEGYERLTFS